MDSTNESIGEVKVKLQESPKEKVKKINIPYTDKAKANLKKNQSRYMKKRGQFLRLDEVAGKLLETATL